MGGRVLRGGSAHEPDERRAGAPRPRPHPWLRRRSNSVLWRLGGLATDEARTPAPSRSVQKQQLFFAPAQNVKTGEMMPRDRVFEVENIEGIVEEGKKRAKKKRPIVITGIGMPPLEVTASGAQLQPLPSRFGRAQLRGAADPQCAGWPSVSSTVLRKLAGEPPHWGTAHAFFGGGAEGERACSAIDALCRAGQIDTMLSNFIVPLQQQVDARGRVHASLNLNTETGRLSSRR